MPTDYVAHIRGSHVYGVALLVYWIPERRRDLAEKRIPLGLRKQWPLPVCPTIWAYS